MNLNHEATKTRSVNRRSSTPRLCQSSLFLISKNKLRDAGSSERSEPSVNRFVASWLRGSILRLQTFSFLRMLIRMNRDDLFALLDEFQIETPSWGYADTGTRFGKFVQPAAASTIEEKLQDAGTVHKFTGCCPTVAVHVLWDFAVGVDASETVKIAQKNGVRIGSINPNVFQDQVYKFGSATSPDERARITRAAT
jgi:hypothetical protein